MTDLIERLASATGPDRELDAAIALASGWRLHQFFCININGAGERGEVWVSPYFTDEDVAEVVSEYKESVAANFWPNNDPPAFTASIDAALTLCGGESGLGSLIAGDFPDGSRSWVARVRSPEAAVAEAPTPALAICIAALKAQEATK